MPPRLPRSPIRPSPIELKQGVRYRFRFINITLHDPLLTVSLLVGSSPITKGHRGQSRKYFGIIVARDGVEPPTQAFSEPWF